jgi:uncharacterized membrane-anchored protein
MAIAGRCRWARGLLPGCGRDADERSVEVGHLRETERTVTEANRTDTAPSRANLALGLGIAAVVANVVGMFISGDDDSNGWIWIVMGLLALAAVVVGLMDGRGKPAGRALVGTILGGLILLEFLLFVIFA